MKSHALHVPPLPSHFPARLLDSQKQGPPLIVVKALTVVIVSLSPKLCKVACLGNHFAAIVPCAAFENNLRQERGEKDRQ